MSKCFQCNNPDHTGACPGQQFDPSPMRGFTFDSSGDYKGLYICNVCGWHVVPTDRPRHKDDECRPRDGKLAQGLAKALAEHHPTMHGRGYGVLTFELDKNLHISFRVNAGKFCLDDVWCLDDLNAAKAADLVRQIAIWSKS